MKAIRRKLLDSETTRPGANFDADKIRRYDWTMQDERGELKWISKHQLVVDEQYQREASIQRVRTFAASWSWIACGVLVVARRQDEDEGEFFVIDGQHRALAAARRSDITDLPCIVFDALSARDEAKGFYASNANRKPLSMFNRWNALLLAEDENAVFVDKLIQHSGRRPATNSSGDTVTCLACLLKAAQSSRGTLTKVWPICVELSVGESIPGYLVEGMMYLEDRLQDQETLTSKKWTERVLKVGYGEIMASIARAKAFYVMGGPRTSAVGILDAINKGLRSRLRAELGQ